MPPWLPRGLFFSGRLCFARLAALVVLVLLLAAHPPAAAQDPSSGRSFALITAEWQRTFDAVDRSTRAALLADKQRRRLDAQLATIIEDAQAFEAEARREIEAQSRLLETLGPPPAEGAPPEPRDVARERKDIQDAIDVYKARLAQAELASARATSLRGDLGTAVRRHFLQLLLERVTSPLAPGVLATAAAQAVDLAAQLVAAPADWYAQQTPEAQSRITWLLAVPFLLGVVLIWALRRPLLGCRPVPADPSTPLVVPPLPVRLVRVARRTLAQGVLPAVALSLPIVVVFAASDLASSGLAADALRGLLLAMALFIGVAAVARAVLLPTDEAMALLPLQRGAAERLFAGICCLALVFALEAGLRQATAGLSLPDELRSARSLGYALLIAASAAAIMRRTAWLRRPPANPPADGGAQAPEPEVAASATIPAPPQAAAAEEDAGEEGRARAAGGGEQRPLRIGAALRHTVTAVALTAPCAAALGYARLAVTVADSIVDILATVAAALLLRAAVLVALDLLLALPVMVSPRAVGTSVTRTALLWLRALLDPVLVALAIYLLAPRWGVPREDLARWGASLLNGFSIGGVTVSITDIALAAIVLVAALAASRALRRTLADRLLPRTRLDRSVQQSISIGVGYLGVVFAVLLAVAVLGINLSSIALVAGALSVGIGFGLQAIVNNFVSGLILLIERPVKVGDWVVVGGHEGFVRRIQVRSTELETFERSTVILPNSELLSNALVNWTHKDKIGRVDVRIGVDYGIDVDKVREVLLACARAHPEVLAWPRPFVLFIDFGDSALIFELRAFLRDVERRMRVGSELRFAIDAAFREAGIDFPYPQHDIHLHDIDRLEEAITGIGRAMEGQPAPATPPRHAPPGRRGPGRGGGKNRV